MKPLGDELRRLLRSFGEAGAMTEIVRAWPGAVGEGVARNAWPARIGRDGTLHVATSSSAWSFELTQLEATVRAQLAEALGGPGPARLRFVPGPLPELGREPTGEGDRGRPEPSSADRSRAAELVAPVEDGDLRALAERAVAASLARRGSGRRL